MIENRKKIEIIPLLRDITKSLLKHLALVLFLASISGGLAFYISHRNYVPLYSSSVTFMVRPAVSATADNVASNYAVVSQISKSFPYIIINDGMKEIIEKEADVRITEKDISVESLADTNSFTVSVTNRDKEKAADILKIIIDHYPEIGEKVIGNTYINIISDINTRDEPVNRNVSKMYAAAVMLAIFACSFVIFAFYSYNKKTVKNSRDLSLGLNMQCLASIPKVKGFKRKHVLISDPKIPYVMKEQVKKLRIKTEGWQRETGAKVFLVTSSLADEGKSTISVNLAMALKEKHHSVLIIDFDFRNPSVLKMLGMPAAETGLFNLMSGDEAKPEDAIIKDDKTEIDVLPSGNLKGHSVKSLINANNLAPVIENLRNSYDFIILDTPPSSILSDSSDIASLSDIGIYVIRSDYAPLSVIEDGLDILSDSSLKVMGCVLNYCSLSGKRYYKYSAYH